MEIPLYTQNLSGALLRVNEVGVHCTQTAQHRCDETAPMCTSGVKWRMQVHKVMSAPLISLSEAHTIRMAAKHMRTHQVGALPVFQENKLVGILTDRDIVIRALAAEDVALGLETKVKAIMSQSVITCLDDQDIQQAAVLMGERQVRRLLIIDRLGMPAGLVSVGDIAEHVSEYLAGQILGEITEARARGRRR